MVKVTIYPSNYWGIWTADYSVSLDNLTSCWIPDINYIYSNFEELGLNDTRSITLGTRFMLSNNEFNPTTYNISKILDLAPQGVLKISLKQDELNRTTDNIELRICDYYTSTGEIRLDPEKNEEDIKDDYKTSEIHYMVIDENDELVEADIADCDIHIGDKLYFEADYQPLNDEIYPEWRIKLVDDDNLYSEKDKTYYENLFTVSKYDDDVIYIKIGKAKSLIGKSFYVTVQDLSGNYYSESARFEIKEAE